MGSADRRGSAGASSSEATPPRRARSVAPTAGVPPRHPARAQALRGPDPASFAACEPPAGLASADSPGGEACSRPDRAGRSAARPCGSRRPSWSASRTARGTRCPALPVAVRCLRCRPHPVVPASSSLVDTLRQDDLRTSAIGESEAARTVASAARAGRCPARSWRVERGRRRPVGDRRPPKAARTSRVQGAWSRSPSRHGRTRSP